VEKLQRFAEQGDGKQRAENRDEVDEQAGAIGADFLDASDIKYLRQQGSEDRRVEGNRPAFCVRPLGRAAGGFPQEQGQGGKGRAESWDCHQRAPVDDRLPAQEDRIDGIGGDGDQHQRIAAVQAELQQGDEIAMGRRQPHADKRHAETDDLGQRNPGAEKDEIQQEDQHGNAGLLDGDVDRCRVLHCRIEHGVEGRVADHAIEEEEGQVFAHHRPVLLQLRQRDGGNQRDGQEPAQEGQHHRADVAERQLACNGIAAPAESCNNEADIGCGLQRGGLPVSVVFGSSLAGFYDRA